MKKANSKSPFGSEWKKRPSSFKSVSNESQPKSKLAWDKSKAELTSSKPKTKSKSPLNLSPVESPAICREVVVFGDDEEIYQPKVPKYKEISHYIKGEVLGKGAFGKVREFIDKKTLQRCAGKIIRSDRLRKDVQLRRSVSRELTITRHLNHRNIMRVYDVHYENAKIYLFMEFCYSELSELLKFYKKLPKNQSKYLFGQIIAGLDYLHARGIMHRDIKPDNILISHGNTVKLADFGVCQILDAFSSDDRVTGNDGTPIYHPPEIFKENVYEYSGSKIDIWASGAVLFLMITGVTPFFRNESGGFEELSELISSNVKYPKEILTDILLADLFSKLLEKDPSRRITIEEINEHPWLMIDHQQFETVLALPCENRSFDIYRGLTVLTRIHEKYYPQPKLGRLVNWKEMEESRKQRPLGRSNRYQGTNIFKVNPVLRVKDLDFW